MISGLPFPVRSATTIWLARDQFSLMTSMSQIPTRVAAMLENGHPALLTSARCNDFHVPVTVEIDPDRLESEREPLADHMLSPRRDPRVSARARTTQPAEPPVPRASSRSHPTAATKSVPAVAVHIDNVPVNHPARRRIDDMLPPQPVRVTAQVLVPHDLPRARSRAYQVHPPTARDLDGMDRPSLRQI